MRKLLVVVMMILALVALSAPAMAQDPMCGTLAAADCDILTQASAASQNLSSATFTFNIDVTVGAQTVPVTGDGSFAFDRAALAAFEDLDPSALSADPAAAFSLVADGLSAIDLTLNLNLMGMPINTILVDGVGYLNFEPLGPALQAAGMASAGLPQGWAGLDLAGGFEMMGPMLGGMMGDMGGMGAPGSTDQMDPAQQEALMQAVTQYATVARIEDEAGSAVFVSTIDFAGLLSDPLFMDMVLEQAAASGQELTEDMLAEATEAIQAIGQGVNISLTQKIDLATFNTTGLSFDFDLDGGTLAAAMGEDAGTAEDFSLAAAFNFADFNSAPAVSAPAGAPVSTFMELMGALSGGF